METTISDSTGISGRILLKKLLLTCGILSSVLYIAMLVFIPALWMNYDSSSQAVSELSAIDAPTRPVWVPLGFIYTLLVTAFGIGVWISAGGRRRLMIVGILIVTHGIIGLAWPPMHQREVIAAGGGSLTDTLHIAFSIVTVLLFLLEIGFGAAVFGKQFLVYSIGTLIILVTFGILTGLDSSGISENLPTPWLGIWERINIGAYLLWVMVLSIVMLREVKRKDQLMIRISDVA